MKKKTLKTLVIKVKLDCKLFKQLVWKKDSAIDACQLIATIFEEAIKKELKAKKRVIDYSKKQELTLTIKTKPYGKSNNKKRKR